MDSTGESNQSKGEVNVTNSNSEDQESSFLCQLRWRRREDNKRDRKQIEGE